jgi:hypothetical protein
MITPKLPPDFFEISRRNCTKVESLPHGHLNVISDERMEYGRKILEKTGLPTTKKYYSQEKNRL